ncbi:FtsK/SpoIIIE domain-containing protein (plasmid) [Bacillus carboniphilus]|uniref:FtsK/SpoIIIE domain-containing protein n=1 Tax=Bacillus carboniphilus TaxID=86663 RepID=A0ABY9JYN9_9BACI|nr:FtsK/SpoIIIE domain-containing protein [Bacillus carboniphilus]WLR44494.1 FtsK/SpoIIIE domain-containing protein [Bacillus carboniphilus]
MTSIKTLLQKFKARRELEYAFNVGGIYISKKNSGGKEIKRMPKIHEVTLFDDRTRYTFTLPNGYDPKEIDKKEYVFKQVFCRSLELKGDLKKYVLTVYKHKMTNEIKYNFCSIKGEIHEYKMPIYCGADRLGKNIIYDMSTKPHLLIAGETGSGKSTQLRQLLTTLILNFDPTELELYLGDCKKAEFHVFRNVKHVKASVTRAHEIKAMLEYIQDEMNQRYDLIETFGVAHIDDLPKEHKKPYMVVCIDEFVMLRKEKEIMAALIDLTALGRAAGIFVVLSMQRPVKEVLDTTIRSNLTVSMGFKVRDKIESRIINTPGAEDIQTPGRFYMNNNGKVDELQAPFLSLDECKKLLEPYLVAPDEAKEVSEGILQIDQQDELLGGWED